MLWIITVKPDAVEPCIMCRMYYSLDLLGGVINLWEEEGNNGNLHLKILKWGVVQVSLIPNRTHESFKREWLVGKTVIISTKLVMNKLIFHILRAKHSTSLTPMKVSCTDEKSFSHKTPGLPWSPFISGGWEVWLPDPCLESLGIGGQRDQWGTMS